VFSGVSERYFVAAASSVAGSGDLLSFHASSSSTGSSSRLRLPHVVGYYETDSRKPFPKDSKKWNVSVDQLKSAIVRLATHAGTSVLAAEGIPSSWAAFAQHVAAIKEQAPNMPCISYDEVRVDLIIVRPLLTSQLHLCRHLSVCPSVRPSICEQD